MVIYERQVCQYAQLTYEAAEPIICCSDIMKVIQTCSYQVARDEHKK